VLAKSLLIASFAISAPVLADTLVTGSVYFDSQKTLDEVVKLSADKNNEGILKLIDTGQVTQNFGSEKDIVILSNGVTPESPAEFRFPNGPSTYWTLTKFVSKKEAVEPAPTPAPEPSPVEVVEVKPAPSPKPAPTPELTPEPEPSSTPTARRRRLESAPNNDPSDNDHGRRIWHKVDGRWKWYPVNRKSAKKADE
jgi:outer membrane biosynthesis protein TonB